jgi:hypothetical protein
MTTAVQGDHASSMDTVLLVVVTVLIAGHVIWVDVR